MESREHRTPESGLPSTPPPNSSPREDLELQEIELEERLNLYNKQALHLARSGRPENTKKAYKPRQKEWRVSKVSICSYKTLSLTFIIGILYTSEVSRWSTGY